MSTNELQPLTAERQIITRYLIESARALTGLDCMRYLKRGDYVGITWEETKAVTRAFALGFQALGLELGGRVALMAKTRYEWRLVDYGILFAGGTTVTVYPSLTSAQLEYIINDSGATMLVVDDARNLKKILKEWSKCPNLKYVFHISPVPNDMKRDTVLSLDDLIARGVEFENKQRKADPQAVDLMRELITIEKKIARSYDKPKITEWQAQAHILDAKIASLTNDPFVTRYLQIKDSDLCTIVYTSGTTGVPKGALLTHHNMAYNAYQTQQVIPLEPHDTALSFLPLSHVLERQVGQFMATKIGFTVAYARDTDSLLENLDQIKPTFMTSVPLIYEKLYNRIMADILTEGKENVQKIFDHANEWGLEYQTKLQDGEEISVGLAFKNWLAHKLVFHKVHEILGGRLRFMFSGGAAINPVLAKFFFGAGFKIMEGYGLTETSPVLTVNRIDKIKFGSVGLPVPDTKIKIAADGEILAQGPQVFQGYWNKPSENETAFSEDAEGKWYHTGDLGSIDEDGFLKITGRKKTLIVLRTGKKVSPVATEAALELDRHIAHAVAIGDDLKYLIGIIEPNWEYLAEWLEQNNLTTWKAKELEVKNDTDKEEYAAIIERRKKILAMPQVTDFYTKIVEETQKNLSDFERIRRFALVPVHWNEYTVMTPSMKVIRRKIVEFYADIIKTTYVE
jgi:long-chain acyl-CoA synthetase